jgi:hypothetical protein
LPVLYVSSTNTINGGSAKVVIAACSKRSVSDIPYYLYRVWTSALFIFMDFDDSNKTTFVCVVRLFHTLPIGFSVAYLDDCCSLSRGATLRSTRVRQCAKTYVCMYVCIGHPLIPRPYRGMPTIIETPKEVPVLAFPYGHEPVGNEATIGRDWSPSQVRLERHPKSILSIDPINSQVGRDVVSIPRGHISIHPARSS